MQEVFIEAYKNCNAHLKDVDRKKEQLFIFYGAIAGVVFSIKDPMSFDIGFFAFFIWLSVLVSVLTISYMRWHCIYINCARTLQRLLILSNTVNYQIDMRLVHDIYCEETEVSKLSMGKYLLRSETLLFIGYLILNSTVIYFLYRKVVPKCNTYQIGILILAIVVYVITAISISLHVYNKVHEKQEYKPKWKPHWVLAFFETEQERVI